MIRLRVPTGPAFTFAFMGVLIATGVALGATIAPRGFPPLPGIRPNPSVLAPRCYEVAWERIDSVYAFWGQINGLARLPRRLLLESSPHPRAAQRDEPWLALSASDPDADSLTIRSAVQFVAWDVAGSDSIDVRLEVFPMTVQFRFPDERQTTRVRALIGWDAPGTTAAELQVTRIECKGSNSSRPTA
jgi:hypothetical protein